MIGETTAANQQPAPEIVVLRRDAYCVAAHSIHRRFPEHHRGMSHAVVASEGVGNCIMRDWIGSGGDRAIIGVDDRQLRACHVERRICREHGVLFLQAILLTDVVGIHARYERSCGVP